MATEQLVDCRYREVAQVLVVDCVEFAVIDQIANVRELQDRHACRLEHPRNTLDETVGIGDVRQHVIGVQHVCRQALLRESRRQVNGEEIDQCLDANRLGGPRRRFGRIDAENGDSGGKVVLQQVAVVARQFDHSVARPEAAARDQLLDVGDRVRLESIRNGREIRIIIAEQLGGRDRVVDLHEAAIVAEDQPQRITSLWLVELFGRQQAVCQRARAKVEHDVEMLRAARAAGFDRAGRRHQALRLNGCTATRRSFESTTPSAINFLM